MPARPCTATLTGTLVTQTAGGAPMTTFSFDTGSQMDVVEDAPASGTALGVKAFSLVATVRTAATASGREHAYSIDAGFVIPF